MKRYDIDWHLKFFGNLNIEIIENITKRLAIEEALSKETYGRNRVWTYKIHRSLDICLPIILTICDELNIKTYRDNKKNAFVVQVDM